MNVRRLSSAVFFACICVSGHLWAPPLAKVSAEEVETQAVQAKEVRLHEESLQQQLELFNPKAMRLAIVDLSVEFPERYVNPGELLKKLDVIEKNLPRLREFCKTGEPEALKQAEKLLAFQKDILLANPLFDFKGILLIRRGLGDGARQKMGRGIGMPNGNYSTMSDTQRKGWDNEVAVLENFLQKTPTLRSIHKSGHGGLISDVDLHVSGEKLMFSAVNKKGVWRLFEKQVSGGELNQLSPDDGNDVDHYDACYLPNDEVVFTSTATFLGMPCIDGQPRMASIYRLNPQSKKIDQLCFEQDSDWCPTVMNDGRVMYLRWEYADMVHSNSRIVMSMNPDGTSQKSYYGSNSYFPNSFFYARPIPGHATQIVGIATGHHGLSRSGRMLVIDPQLGTREAEGVVREIPGRGKKVVAEVKDRLVDGVWPQILHPFPLAEKGSHRGAGKYFLVSMKPKAGSLWGIYLVDVFDNITLIKEMEGQGLFEPVPLRREKSAPIIADRVDPEKKTATVYIQDIYQGPGLKGVPRGEVDALRVGAYHFSPHGSGGLIGTLGMDGPWDIKRVLGTVPVFKDGSATFEIPANTPIFLQPLDKSGQALQTMRSWFVGRPGERVSCVGCHESSREAPQPKMSLASTVQPQAITPWLGKQRPFSFRHEIQPVLERKCNSCHDGKAADGRYESRRLEYQDKPIPHFSAELIDDWDMTYSGRANDDYAGRFSKAYSELHRFVRRAGIESDMRILTPKEFSADTTELVQLLRKGHHGVKLSGDEWSRLLCWIDFNAPYHGYRKDVLGKLPKKHEIVMNSMTRANELSQKYAGVDSFHQHQAAEPIKPKSIMPNQSKQNELRKKGLLSARFEIAKERKDAQTINLGQGQKIKLVYIPSGSFNMGSGSGALDELPMSRVKIPKGYFMAEAEVSNAQMRCFDRDHDSRDESWKGYQFGARGYDMNLPEMPAVRLSWEKAVAFCHWLSEKTGRKVTLPTEAQWEWACRAGKAEPFWFGAMGTDFATYANLADQRISEMVMETATDAYSRQTIIKNPSKYMDYIPKDTSVDDGSLLPRLTKGYQPNPWGLYDMHGNVAEWTRSRFESYPYAEDGRNSPDGKRSGKRVVRGGSWHDRPYRATASFRLPYPQFQQIYNVGFRVIVEE